ncbi:MAG: hypothetical protein GXP62_13105, partial [Oligoflexia bacterium]|nr:hypothetical protein [Oligoflexia bacterium]
MTMFRLTMHRLTMFRLTMLWLASQPLLAGCASPRADDTAGDLKTSTSTSTSTSGTTSNTGSTTAIGDQLFGDLSWYVDYNIGSLVTVRWQQAQAATVHIEFSVDPDVWLQSPPFEADAGD